MGTGGGKTFTFCEIIAALIAYGLPGVVIAHRREILFQISMALAEHGILHNVIGPKALIKDIISGHVLLRGRSFYSPKVSLCTVASIDTLARQSHHTAWLSSLRWGCLDEGHHALEANKWGKVITQLINAFFFAVTATPCRADGLSLERGSGGVYDELILGPDRKELTDLGFLVPFVVYGPPPLKLHLERVKLTAKGDYNQNQLAEAVQAADIFGNAVQEYKKRAMGLRGITFAVNHEHCEDVTRRYNEAGVPAAFISSKTPDLIRMQMVKDLKSGKLLQLVNVDILTEGFDCPSVGVVTMLRPTASFNVFDQEAGRGCRSEEGKTYALLLDLVNNCARFGGPGTRRTYTLQGKAPVVQEEEKTLGCLNCTRIYFAYLTVCPYCGFEKTVVKRSVTRKEMVEIEGDLEILDSEMKNLLVKEIKKRLEPVPEGLAARLVKKGMSPGEALKRVENWTTRQETLVKLRDRIAEWSGAWRDEGIVRIRDRGRFFFAKFGIDILSAQLQPATEMAELIPKIHEDLTPLKEDRTT